jgi:ligand-binding sensor domain-containing protein
MKKILLLSVLLSSIVRVSAQAPGWVNYTSPTILYSGAFEGSSLWIASNGGLIKFDTTTKSKEYFNPFNSGLPCLSVFAVAIDKDNNKWIGTGGGRLGTQEATLRGRGLAKFDGANWSIFNSANSGLPDNTVRSLFYDNANNLWIGTFGGLAKMSGNNWQVFNRANSGIPSDSITCIAQDMDGIIWLGTQGRGIASFDGTSWTNYSFANSGLAGDTIRAIAIGPNNEKWIGTSRGASKFVSGNWDTYRTNNSGLPLNNVVSLFVDEAGLAWMGTYHPTGASGNGLAKFDGQNWEVLNNSNSGLPTNSVSVILKDAASNMWISSERGHQKGGGQSQISRVAGNSWNNFELAENGLLSNYHYSIVLDKNGHVWMGGEKAGITRFDGTNWINYNTDNSNIPDDDCFNIQFNKNGDMWASFDGGRIASFNGTNFTTYFLPNGSNENPFAMAFDSLNNVWLGSTTGLFKFDGTDWEIYTPANSGLPHQRVNAIAFDSTGKLWIGTHGGGLAILNGNNWEVYSTSNSNLPNDIIRSIAFEGNLVWVATNNGVGKFDGLAWERFRTGNSGLPHNSVHSVAVDSKGIKWIGTDQGIVKFNGANWELMFNFIGNPISAVREIQFSADNKIWIATSIGGIAAFNNSSLPNFIPIADLPAKSQLRNFPNPFSYETVIEFDGTMADKAIDLKVYNISGKEVNFQYEIFLKEGEASRIVVKPVGLPDGIYFFTIRNAGNLHTGKMIIRK